MKIFFLLLLTIGMSSVYADFPVAFGEKPLAEIVVPEVASPEIRFAAQELQKWIRAISGAEPGIYHVPTKQENQKIFLGKEFFAPVEDFRFLGDSDGWLVRQQGKKLFITSPKDSGVINGVFRLLEWNTDLIFPRPVFETEAVFTLDPNLTFRKTDFRGRPSWKYRDFGLVNVHYDPLTSLWARRNYSNHRGMFYNKYHILSNFDLFFPAMLSYEFGRLLPNDKYFERHPDFFAWQEGKRKPYEHYGPQLCYTNEAGRKALIQELFARLKEDLTPQIAKIDFGFGDTWSLCNCVECRKPIPLEDGSVLTPEDDAFRSAQYFRYLNAIAEELTRQYPHLEFQTLGYLYAAVPPKIQLHPKLTVIYCPYPKNDKLPVTTPQNQKWGDRSRNWAKSGKQIGIYEYWGDSSDFPRPVADAAAENLRFWNQLGIHQFVSTETYPDVRREQEKDDTLAGAWDVSAMEYWVLSRLMLDSSQDPQTLREEYLRKVYGPAAQPMKEYYSAIREAWRKEKRASMWNDNAVDSAELYIRRTGLEKDLRAKLDSAENLAVNPAVKQLVKDHRKRFEYQIRTAVLRNPDIFQIPLKEGNDFLNFDASVWQSAAVIQQLKIIGAPSKNVEVATSLRLLHDRRNLYLRFQCAEPDKSRLEKQKAPYPGRFPVGDRIELFLMPLNGKNYYHFAGTPKGAKYEAEGYNHRWNASWDYVVRENSSGWEGILRIPLDAVGIQISVNSKLKLLPARYRGDAEKGEASSYSGFNVHTPLSMPEMILSE